jgi:hypothetical protein
MALTNRINDELRMAQHARASESTGPPIVWGMRVALAGLVVQSDR